MDKLSILNLSKCSEHSYNTIDISVYGCEKKVFSASSLSTDNIVNETWHCVLELLKLIDIIDKIIMTNGFWLI